jgi:hypothetical protein
VEYIEAKNKIEEYIKENWVTVAIFMYTSMGFPFWAFKLKFEGLNLIEQFAFLNQYEKKLKFDFKTPTWPK